MEILKRIEDTYPKMTRKQKKIADINYLFYIFFF